ncbi:MAG TPA: arginine--tRNA ligase [Saprospiraceae bacterium]|nr:arginine--tRNA ligase [Saprospiraceae bacterium]
MLYLIAIKHSYIKAVQTAFGIELSENDVLINETRKEFDGDYTFVIFPLVKTLGKSPEDIGKTIGEWLVTNDENIVAHNTIKGFLNLTLSFQFWTETIKSIAKVSNYGIYAPNGKKVMVEFASPNTNKPLHLGHIRNILLGWSCNKILQANGYEVIKTQVINDRGIAICKSMLAWQKFGNDTTPSSTQVKGDHFVGEYYVRFEQELMKEYNEFQSSAEGIAIYNALKKEGQDQTTFFKEYKNKYFNDHSALGAEAKQMLINWEAKDPETVALWQKMNQWVYDGFDVTYEKLGVTFDSLYYESDTYLLGKKAVDDGIKKGVFYQEPDSSVWVNLEDVGMDRKIVMRSDGTSVYITQDIGTAQQRYADYGIDKMVYTVADEQDYHFKVLFEILKRLNEPFADGLYHLSYGMIDLPTGKMKSREGTVVDADDLIAEVIAEATEMSAERGEIVTLPEPEQINTLRKIGLGALKYFIIKVQPKKRMIFDPKESVDMQGQTGPYIQNAYVRIQSIIRKAGNETSSDAYSYADINEQEKTLIKHIMNFPDIVKEAGEQYDPSSIANYSYALAKDFHRFYHDVRILNAESSEAKSFRIQLSILVGDVLLKAFDMIGIEMPERM